MIRFVILFPVVLILTVIFLTSYLQPNDLKSCNNLISNKQDCQKANLIIVISGGDTIGRTQTAIDLLKKGWADKILFSGAALDKTGPSNALVMKNLALKSGVDEASILLDETSETTQQNAKNAKTIISTNNYTDIILVTSPYHQRRAYIEFSRVLETINIRNYSAVDDKDWSLWWWTSLRGWTLAVSETAKIMALKLRGIL